MNAATGAALAGGASVLQGLMQYQAKRQDHTNQLAYKRASDEYAQWSAGMQAQQANLNNSYKYWQEQVNHGQELIYANQLRNFELSKAVNSAQEVGRARTSATTDYWRQSQALQASLSEASMVDAMSIMQYKMQGLRAAASVSAAGVGMVDRYVNDYARQVGDMQTMKTLNAGFRQRQYTREQAGKIAEYLNNYNSQQFYEVQEVNDPLAPFPPLPTLINPAPPSMVGGAPSLGAAIVGGLLGGVQTAASTYGALKPS